MLRVIENVGSSKKTALPCPGLARKIWLAGFIPKTETVPLKVVGCHLSDRSCSAMEKD